MHAVLKCLDPAAIAIDQSISISHIMIESDKIGTRLNYVAIITLMNCVNFLVDSMFKQEFIMGQTYRLQYIPMFNFLPL